MSWQTMIAWLWVALALMFSLAAYGASKHHPKPIAYDDILAFAALPAIAFACAIVCFVWARNDRR